MLRINNRFQIFLDQLIKNGFTHGTNSHLGTIGIIYDQFDTDIPNQTEHKSCFLDIKNEDIFFEEIGVGNDPLKIRCRFAQVPDNCFNEFVFKRVNGRFDITIYDCEINVFVNCLTKWAYKSHGYNVSVPLANEAAIVTILCLQQMIGKDLARLIGQYVYKTRYNTKVWK